MLTLAALTMASCYTIDAFQALPEGYWTATWGILESLFKDIVSIVKMVF